MKIGLLFPKGLLHAVQAELRMRALKTSAGSFHPMRNQDLFICELERSQLATALELRTVEDIFLMLGASIPLAKRSRSLRFFEPHTKELILEGLSHKARGPSRKIRTGFAVFVKQDRDYPLHRKSISSALSEEVTAYFNRWSYRDPADVEFWVFLSKSRLNWGLRLTSLGFRQRDYRNEQRHGSLLPVIAAALCVLAKPKPDEVVLDPMCGTGTLLIERGTLLPTKAAFGFDIDRDAVSLARANAERAGIEIKCELGDTTQSRTLTSLRRGVDVLLCNLPYGKQFANSAELYERALVTWRDVLRPRTGRMVLLTPHEGTLRRAARSAGLKMSHLLHCNVRGIMVGLFLLVPVRSDE